MFRIAHHPSSQHGVVVFVTVSSHDDGSKESFEPSSSSASKRKQLLVRLNPVVHDALAKWASDELRSVNAQIELVLRQALDSAGRLPRGVGALPRRGRPPKER